MRKNAFFTFKTSVLLPFCILPLLLSGCAEVKEINDMAIISGLSVDISDNGAWRVTAEVVNKTEGSSPEETKAVIGAEGSTLADALENCNFQDSRQIYFSHAKSLVVSKKLAETEGIEPVLDYIMRNYKMRLSTDLIVSDLDSAAAVSELSSSSSGLIYYDLEEMVKTDHQYGACSPTKVYQAVNTLRQSGTELTVPLVREEDGRAALYGTAVFQGGSMIATLTPQETLYLLMLQDHLETAHISLPSQEASFQILNEKTSCQAASENGGPALAVSLDLTCSISQEKGGVMVPPSEALSDELASMIRKSCEALIQKAQQWNSDIFSFGKSMEDLSYDFADLPIHVTCTVTLKTGEVH